VGRADKLAPPNPLLQLVLPNASGGWRV